MSTTARATGGASNACIPRYHNRCPDDRGSATATESGGGYGALRAYGALDGSENARLRFEIVFHILVVDDDSAGASLLQELVKNLQRPCELHFVRDGEEALDFLHCRGAYLEVPRPNLILLDLNMPRLGGLETLSVIKTNPGLCVIPVIVLSSSNAPRDVRESYRAHANCYVQKPTDLDRSVKLVQAIEAFWMDFALLPACDEPAPQSRQSTDSKSEHSAVESRTPRNIRSGPPISSKPGVEATSQAMNDSPARKTGTAPRKSGCEEHARLLDNFGVAVRELIDFHEQQFLAIVEGDSECSRFDLLIHLANENKQLAKYAYLRHVEAHGCSILDDLK